MQPTLWGGHVPLNPAGPPDAPSAPRAVPTSSPRPTRVIDQVGYDPRSLYVERVSASSALTRDGRGDQTVSARGQTSGRSWTVKGETAGRRREGGQRPRSTTCPASTFVAMAGHPPEPFAGSSDFKANWL